MQPRPGHVAEDGSPEFMMLFDVPPGEKQRNEWRWCTNCYTLGYLPEAADSDCAAGGQPHADEYNYVLDSAATR